MGKDNNNNNKLDLKRTILNDANYHIWQKLTLSVIGLKNRCTLHRKFTPFINEYARPIPPSAVIGRMLKRDVDDANNDNDSDDSTSEPESQDSAKSDGERSDEEDEDEKAVLTTMTAIREGLSKTMQATYANFDTPASLWKELKRKKDPKNRTLDTTAADSYRELKMRENQSIQDYIDMIQKVEDQCTAVGEKIHLGYQAQKTVRLKLDHHFSQALLILTVQQYANVVGLEKAMRDLWDAYIKAENLNKPAKPPVTPVANVTVTDGKRPAGNDHSPAKRRNYGGKAVKCTKCPGNHNPNFDCDSCWKCGSKGHLSRDCPTKPNPNGRGNGNAPSAAPASVMVAAAVHEKEDNSTPKGWTPFSGLLTK
ncbi:UNVERIFIED_CONTAM: hypothetical protein HDU68_002398 [Siphonaria sp. JEL0065]|nr:hypothetical protein HDU68_002398 [Siphonaria sp. JEL0065]